MPIYEYEHDEEGHDCDERIETFQKMSEDALTECPKCGKACHKVFSRTRGKVEQNRHWVYEDKQGNLHHKELSADKTTAAEQVRQHYRSKGENPDNYEIMVP